MHTPHPLHRLSRLLLDLPSLAPDGDAQAFGTAAVARLAAAVSADSGIWASGALTAAGPDFHTVALWRQPPALLAEYEAIKQHDPLFREAAAQPGRAFSGAAALLPAVFAPFVARFGLAQALSVMAFDAASGLLNGVSLWRSAADRPFTPDDEVLLEAALPHLVARAQTRLLRRPWPSAAPPPPAARGCADLRGRLHAATPPFLALLAAHWPEWRGPDLPADLAQRCLAVARAQQRVLGALVVRSTPGASHVLIDLRLRQPWDGLSPREQGVASLAAAGHTHKAIAQALGLAPATVRNHLARIYRTLGVHSRAQLQVQRAAASFEAEPAADP